MRRGAGEVRCEVARRARMASADRTAGGRFDRWGRTSRRSRRSPCGCGSRAGGDALRCDAALPSVGQRVPSAALSEASFVRPVRRLIMIHSQHRCTNAILPSATSLVTNAPVSAEAGDAESRFTTPAATAAAVKSTRALSVRSNGAAETFSVSLGPLVLAMSCIFFLRDDCERFPE